jgi:hypothetical protein
MESVKGPVFSMDTHFFLSVRLAIQWAHPVPGSCYSNRQFMAVWLSVPAEQRIPGPANVNFFGALLMDSPPEINN